MTRVRPALHASAWLLAVAAAVALGSWVARHLP